MKATIFENGQYIESIVFGIPEISIIFLIRLQFDFSPHQPGLDKGKK
jgi:hypothetical protein